MWSIFLIRLSAFSWPMQSVVANFKRIVDKSFGDGRQFRWDSPLRKNGRTFDNWDIQRIAPATSLACSLRVARLGVIER